jgi:hypothetical protein
MITPARARDPAGCYRPVTTGNSRNPQKSAICYHVTAVTTRLYSYVCACTPYLLLGNKGNKVTNRSGARVCGVTFRFRNGNGGNSLPALVFALHLRAVAAQPSTISWLWAGAATLAALHWRRP